VHDVLITAGIFAIFQLEFDLSVLAALLGLMGYSLNDTIIVYDRIRENMATHTKHNLVDVLNRSVNETLSRTLLTSLNTLATVLCLLLPRRRGDLRLRARDGDRDRRRHLLVDLRRGADPALPRAALRRRHGRSRGERKAGRDPEQAAGKKIRAKVASRPPSGRPTSSSARARLAWDRARACAGPPAGLRGHLDRAVHDRALGDDQTRRDHITLDDARGLDLDALGAAHVAGHAPDHDHRLRLHLGLDRAVRPDREHAVGQSDFAFDLALDHEVLFAGEITPRS
jgi:hypothetical protein